MIDLFFVLQVNKWFEILQAIAAHPSPAIQRRAAFLLCNIITHEERGLAEHLSKSNMLEVLMALTQQPDIKESDALPPETIVLSHVRADWSTRSSIS